MAQAPLRVTHVIPQIGIGGAEMQLRLLIAATPADRAVHRVLYYSDSLDEAGFQVYADSGIDFSRVERGPGGPAAFLWRLAKAIAGHRPHVVHCWLPSAVLWGRWAALLAGVRHVVQSFRSSRIDLRWLTRASRLADGRGTHYLANSTAAAASVERILGVPRGRIRVIHNGIDLATRAVPAPPDSLLRSHGCPPGTRVALSVGRLTDAKNYAMLLRIAARCRGRLPVHFFVIGHGEQETAIKALAREMRLDDSVHFLGLRLDVPALLPAADVFCYTSRYEGFPNALLEAMAAARPIVSTRFDGIEDLVEPGATACVVAQDDDEGGFEALRSLVEDPGTARALGAAARRRVEERFGARRMVDATLGYYEAIVRGAA